MDKLEILELEMQLIAQVGNRFYNALEKAKTAGINTDFCNEAYTLIKVLSGDKNSGVRESVRDAEKDNLLIAKFLDNWGDDSSIRNYSEVMKGARATKNAHDEFLKTVKDLSEKEKIDIEKFGRINESSGCRSYEAGYETGEKQAQAVKGLFNGIRRLFK